MAPFPGGQSGLDRVGAAEAGGQPGVQPPLPPSPALPEGMTLEAAGTSAKGPEEETRDGTDTVSWEGLSAWPAHLST